MKQGKRLTRDMKIKLADINLNPKNWQYTKSTPEELTLVHKVSGKTRVIKQ